MLAAGSVEEGAMVGTYLEERSSDGIAALGGGLVVSSGEAGEEGSEGDLGEHVD
jgi:hypothetical protein